LTGFVGRGAVEHGEAHDRLQHEEGLAGAGVADAGRGELGAIVGNDLGGDLVQPVPAEVGQDVPIPHAAVATQSRLLEVWLGVQSPPLNAVIGEQLVAGVEVGERAEPLAAPDFGLEVLSVGLAVKHAAAVAAALSVAHFPDVALLPSHFAGRLHGSCSFSLATRARKLPRGRGTGGRVLRRTVASPLAGAGTPSSSQARRSSTEMRQREQRFVARNSPRSIAP
jgi:hypothetical protein